MENQNTNQAFGQMRQEPHACIQASKPRETIDPPPSPSKQARQCKNEFPPGTSSNELRNCCLYHNTPSLLGCVMCTVSFPRLPSQYENIIQQICISTYRATILRPESRHALSNPLICFLFRHVPIQFLEDPDSPNLQNTLS